MNTSMSLMQRFRDFSWLAVAIALSLFGCQAFAEERVTFQDVVNKNFDRWTEGHAGVLTAERTRELVLKADIHGVEAAALAAVHAYLKRSGTAESVSREILLGHKSEDPTLRHDEAASGANIARNFAAFSRHIQSAPRRLFAVERPSIDTLTQGNLGDCYFVAAVGSLAHRDPERILKMIKQNRDHTFDVHFPSGQQVTVPILSDAQLALSSNAGQQGIWLNVLEIAAGIVRRESKTTELALDNIGAGGDSAFSIRLLTGHAVDKYRIRHEVNGQYPAPEEKDIDALALRIGNVIRTGLNRHELICCSTGKWDLPPGFVKTHEYAVLGFKDGYVDLWNPWGYKYNFTPKGKSSFENGFYFEGGRCSIPLRAFIKIFGRVAIERIPDSKPPVNQVAKQSTPSPTPIRTTPAAPLPGLAPAPAPATKGPVPHVPVDSNKLRP